MVEDGLDALAGAAGGFGYIRPYRLQRFNDKRRVDIRRGNVMQRRGIFVQCHAPLCRVFWIGPFVLLELQERVDALLERRSLCFFGGCGLPLSDTGQGRVNAAQPLLPAFPRTWAGLGKADRMDSPESDVTLAAAVDVAVDPASTRAAIGDLEVQPMLIEMPAVANGLGGACGQFHIHFPIHAENAISGITICKLAEAFKWELGPCHRYILAYRCRPVEASEEGPDRIPIPPKAKLHRRTTVTRSPRRHEATLLVHASYSFRRACAPRRPGLERL